MKRYLVSRPPLARRLLTDSALVGGLSSALLAWLGQRESGSAAAPFNAVSHWRWGAAALRRDDADLRHTALGAVTHAASAALWAGVYGWLRDRRRNPNAVNAVGDALLVTGVAAVVDLKLVPERLTPGFEHRLSRPGLTAVYAVIALGLALGGLNALERRR